MGVRLQSVATGMRAGIGCAAAGAVLAIAALATLPRNQLDGRFALWQDLAGFATALGALGLLLGAVSSFRSTRGLVITIVVGALAVTGGLAILAILETLPIGD